MTSGSYPPESSNDNINAIYGKSGDRYAPVLSDPDNHYEVPSITTTSPDRKQRRGGILREIVETALIALVIFFGVRMLVLNFRVDGSSMFPNLHDGDMLLVNRNAYESFDLYTLIDWLPGVDHADAKEWQPFADPKRGDIIVFDPPVSSSKPYIKRIIGLPGETVEIRDGNVYIDGELLEESYIEPGITDCTRECTPWEIPEGQVFVMGDNRQNSSDSRVFGPIDIDSILGRAWVIYWPAGDMGLLNHADYPDE